MRKPNFRFLLIWALVFAVVTIGAVFVHAYQAKRTAGILLLKARETKADGNLAGAAKFYDQYLAIVPDDTEALGEYGLALAHLPGASNKAISVLENVLRRDPSLHDVRQTLVEIAVANYRYSDAQAHLETHLLKEHPEDGHLWMLLGVCQEGNKEYEAAAQSYRKAIEKGPTELQAYIRLATVLRRNLRRADEAQQAIDLMIAKNPDSAEAHQLRGRFYRDCGSSALAATEAEKSVELDDKNVDYVLFAALASHEAGDFDKAMKYASLARKLDSHKPELYLVLSELGARESSDKALAALQEGLIAAPDNKELLWNLAKLQIDRGEYRSAEETIARLRTTSKDAMLCDYLSGCIALHQGRVLDATNAFETVQGQLTDRKALQKEADFWLGTCYDRIGQVDKRIEAYRQAVNDDPTWQPALMGLAAALAESGRIDEAVDNYQRLVSETGFVAALDNYQRLKDAGKDDEAKAFYLQAIKPARAAAACYQELARLLVIQQLRLPSENRDWKAADSAVMHAGLAMPDSPDSTILRAEIFVAQKQTAEAETLLDQACQNKPDVIQLWIARSSLAIRQGHIDVANAILNSARDKLGDRAVLRQEEIRLTLQLSRRAAVDKLATLATGWERFSPDEQFELNRQMAVAYSILGDFDKAEVFWNVACRARPEWLPGYLFLFDVAAGRKDEAKLNQILDAIRRIERHSPVRQESSETEVAKGNDDKADPTARPGPLWCYGEAARQLLLSEGGDHSHLTKARQLLQEALVQRPRWSRAFYALAEVEKRDGNLAGATERYQTALELGERSPSLIRNLVALLYQRQRFADADRVLRQLEEQRTPFSSDLTRMASDISWRVQDYGRALELAKNAAAESKDVDDHLWLGQLLDLMHQPANAEQAFRDAINLKPAEMRAWQALLQHTIRQFNDVKNDAGQSSPAQIAEARAKTIESVEQAMQLASQTLAGEQVAILRAGAMESLDQTKVADSEYRRALQLKPLNPDVLSKVGEYFVRVHDSTAAEKVFRTLLDPKCQTNKDDLVLARRQLALLMLASREPAKLHEAISLIDLNMQPGSEEDQRIKAVLLGSLPAEDAAGRANRAAAIEILEQLAARSANSLEDTYLLAQLYEMDAVSRGLPANEWWPRVRKMMLSLAVTPNASAKFLATYARGLLIHNEVAEAETWVHRLEQEHPDDLQTTEVRAEWDVNHWRISEALAGIKAKAASLPDQSGLQWSADLLDRLVRQCKDQLEQLPASKAREYQDAAQPMIEAAEQLYQQLCKDDPKERPAAVGFLARQGQISQALMICESWSNEGDPNALVMTAGVASLPTASAEERQRGEHLVVQYLQMHPTTPRLFTALGSFYESQRRIDEAIKAYRQALEADQHDVVALNNLALLLAYRDQPKEALSLIDRAIQIAGSTAPLRDTRGTVLMALGQTDSAIHEFSAAIADQSTAPRWYHLAKARLQVHQTQKARQAFQQAVELKLKPEQLHELEQSDYMQVASKLSSVSS